MRYNDEELFGITTQQYNSWLDDNWTPREYFNHCIRVLKANIEESIHEDDWLDPSKVHLRTYRNKAIIFYQEKIK